METKEYFEKVMQDFNQHRNGRNLRKYCQMEGIDYKWLQEYKNSYGPSEPSAPSSSQSFIPLAVEEERKSVPHEWRISCLRLESPDGGFIEIASNDLAAVTILLQNLSMPC